MVKREKRSLQGCPCCTVKTQAPHGATRQAIGREGKKMLTVYDLTREQINQLKEAYLDQHLQETCDECASYGEIANAGEIVDDWLIYDAYADTLFSPDDFW